MTFRLNDRVKGEKMEVLHSICPSCSLGCGINLITNENKVLGTYPYQRHPVNEGKTCYEGRQCYKLIDDEKRLKNPLINKNSKLIKSDWEEALDVVVSKMESYSSEEIGIIGSGKCANEEMDTLKELANTLNIENIGFFTGNMPKFEIKTASLEDVENSNFILIMGDVIKENPLLGRRVILASDKGAEIITIDTLNKTFTGINSDEYIKTESISKFLDTIDLELINKLNESSVIIFNKLDNQKDFETIHNIAENSKSKILPVMEDCNTWGIMKILPALDKRDIENLINNVKLLYVVGANPASFAEESLKHIDFLITQSSHINETVLLSDVVLPASCWAEKTGTFINTTGVPQKISKILSTPDDVLEDEIIIKKIAEKMGIEL
jgi:formate dehydrogenase major subunit